MHHFSPHVPKSVASFSAKRLLIGCIYKKERSEISCIHLMLPSVCLSPRYVKASLSWSISSAGMKLRMFMKYTEPSTMRIGEAVFEQLANVVSFRVADTIFLEKKYFSATGRCCSKRYLWRKIEISMLYFSPNSSWKRKTSNSYLSTSWHATCLRSQEFGCITYAEGATTPKSIYKCTNSLASMRLTYLPRVY